MYRVAVAGFQHETNTFSPIPTDFKNFSEGGLNATGLLKGEQILYFESEEMNNASSGFLRRAKELDMQCLPVLWAESEPSNMASRETFDQVMGIIEEGIRELMPLDGVFLDLHGAMIFADHQDGEAEILRRLRSIVGDIPIVASLDLHANLSPESIELASVLDACRTYPHIDFYETGSRCAETMQLLLSGKQLHKAHRQIPFLIPTSSQDTNQEPVLHVYEVLQQWAEDPEIISVSAPLGFPPGDIECCGPCVLAYASSQQKADTAVKKLYDGFMGIEDECISRLVPMEEAVEQALELSQTAEMPVILADAQDNPGGGSGSDTVDLIRELLKRNVQDAAVALLYDPDSAAAACQAGEGALIELKLGGKTLPESQPLQAEFRVEAVFDGLIKAEGPMAKGMTIDLGKMALLKIGGIYISVSSKRIQAADQAVFRIFGLDPVVMNILVLKSFIHFRAAFSDISSRIISVEAPGAEFDDPSKVQYRRLRKGVRLYGKGPEHQ